MTLTAVRETAKLTIAELAKKAHLDERTIKRLEATDAKPDASALPRKITLAKFFRGCGSTVEEANRFAADKLAEMEKRASEAPLHPWLVQVLTHAIECNASDIHIDNGKVRLRVAGRLKLTEMLAPADFPAMTPSAPVTVSKFSHAHHGRTFQIRSCSMSTSLGASHVYRLMAPPVERTLRDIFFCIPHLAAVAQALRRQSGLILLSGPAGCGRTTAIAAMLRELDLAHLAITSIASPAEISIETIRHLVPDLARGQDFATLFRTALRSDPDILICEDIRDSEAARCVYHAAITGTLVIASLHAPTAEGAISRLADLGIPIEAAKDITILSINLRLAPNEQGTDRIALTETFGRERNATLGRPSCLETAVKQGLISAETMKSYLAEY